MDAHSAEHTVIGHQRFDESRQDLGTHIVAHICRRICSTHNISGAASMPQRAGQDIHALVLQVAKNNVPVGEVLFLEALQHLQFEVLIQSGRRHCDYCTHVPLHITRGRSRRVKDGDPFFLEADAATLAIVVELVAKGAHGSREGVSYQDDHTRDIVENQLL